MSKKENRHLLLWPPLLVSSSLYLPLGIPFLASYLRNKGIDDLEVFDMNVAYLQKMRCFWFTDRFQKRYRSFTGTVSHVLQKIAGEKDKYRAEEVLDQKTKGPHVALGGKALWKRTVSYLARYADRKMSDVLSRTNRLMMESIPWSLESMLVEAFRDTDQRGREIIHRILKPIIDKKTLSLLGISVIYPQQLFFALMICKIVKEEFDENIFTVLGGTQVTKHIRELVRNNNVYSFVDAFVTNDGEEPLLRLVKQLARRDFWDIPNLYFKSSDTKRGYKTSGKTFCLLPEEFLVPDFKGFDSSYYLDAMPVLASKGCFWSKCTFCTYSIMYEHKYYTTKVEKTLDVIKGMKNKYGVSVFNFVDDALSPKFMKRLARELIEEGLNIKWHCSIILSKEFANQDFCKILKRSGLSLVKIGLESISSRILRLMNKCHKNLRESEVKEVLVSLKGAGIDVGLHIIFGFPTETEDEACQTLKFLMENAGLYRSCWMQPFALEENTLVFNNPERFGITKIHKEDKASGQRLGYRYEVTKGMSQEEVRRFMEESREIASLRETKP